jgi:hypothetical protein
METRVRALAAVSLLLAAGCSHTFFQYHPNRFEQARAGLAAGAAGGEPVVAQVVDVSGRRAVETLLAGVTVESTAADVQTDRMIRALYLGILDGGQDPMSAFNLELVSIAGRFAAARTPSSRAWERSSAASATAIRRGSPRWW